MADTSDELGDFFDDVVFSERDTALIGLLEQTLEVGGTALETFTKTDPPDALVALVHRSITAQGGGCRLAAPPSTIFEVTAGEGHLVTRCGHAPHHEWHGRKRVK